MSPVGSLTPITETSPRLKARIAGVLYVVGLLTAIAGEAFLHGKVALAAGYVAVFLYVIMTSLLYKLFRPVNQTLSALAAVLNLIGLSFEALRWNPAGVDIALVFSGGFCFVIACLVYKSSFLPRIFAALVAISGVAWVTFISPAFADHPSPYNVAAGILGEGSLMLWLLIMGLNEQRWREQVGSVEHQ